MDEVLDEVDESLICYRCDKFLEPTDDVVPAPMGYEFCSPRCYHLHGAGR